MADLDALRAAHQQALDAENAAEVAYRAALAASEAAFQRWSTQKRVTNLAKTELDDAEMDLLAQEWINTHPQHVADLKKRVSMAALKRAGLVGHGSHAGAITRRGRRVVALLGLPEP